MIATDNKASIKGGEFLIKDTDASQVFIPEEFTEEQQMIAATCREFLAKEIWPRLDEIDAAKSPDLMSSLMDKAGELGLLGTSVPEEYGGFGMNFNTSMLVAEATGAGHSFSVALSAHTGIGTLPIVYYGNDEQKAKYLPKLATGEWKAAYCLTEPDSGSDANSGKTKAKLTEDGKFYTVTGQKMWITNGGFADLYIVFAKIDDDKNLSAFIVERSYEGITMNEPEHKLGIKGSDTRQVFFTDVKVPVENLLSERGNGFKIAVNILNIGRIKLGIAVVGGAKQAINDAVRYSNERKQFGINISRFGAIKHKLGEMAIKVYASESASYRAGQNIDDAIEDLKAGGMDDATAKLKALEQFAIECAIMKVHGSEVLDYVVDEGVQVYGLLGRRAHGACLP
jgi:alkylation response protein AidB-like acyl-CoA dehydrogenase